LHALAPLDESTLSAMVLAYVFATLCAPQMELESRHGRRTLALEKQVAELEATVQRTEGKVAELEAKVQRTEAEAERALRHKIAKSIVA
jgi:septal ring factor EnvC (AmiA/AmiB activator)